MKPLLHRRFLDCGAALLFLVATLALTRPWFHDPLGLLIAGYDPASGLVSPDVMLSLSLGGWFNFALAELHRWPLAFSTYLMFPCGAAHGVSYDGFLLSALTGLGWCVMPLGLAYTLALLAGVWALGFATYRLGNKLWGRGAISFAVGLCAVGLPWITQRLACHPNLIHIWVLPVAIHLHLNWRLRPSLKRAAALGGGIVLLAASSWYMLIMGLVYLGPALALDLLAVARRKLWRFLPRFAAIGAVALAGILVLGWQMLWHAGGRRPITLDELQPYSVPLVQWLLPFPNSWLANQPWVASLQAHVGTQWEGFAGGPLAALLLMVFFFLPRRRRHTAPVAALADAPRSELAGEPERPGAPVRVPLAVALVIALAIATGPRLQVLHLLPVGQGLPMPTWLLGQLSHAFLIFRVPGRIHPLVDLIALLAAGCVLADWLRRPRPAKVHQQALAATMPTRALVPRLLGATLLGGFTILNLIGSVSFKPYVVAPVPRPSPFFAQLAGTRGGAVLDVPGSYYWFPHYNFDQLFHRRPIVCSTLFHDGLLPANQRYINESRELVLLSDAGAPFATTDTLARAASPAWRAQLARDGIEYIVVHPAKIEFLIANGALPASMRSVFAQLEAAWRPALVYQDQQLRAYRTGDVAPPRFP